MPASLPGVVIDVVVGVGHSDRGVALPYLLGTGGQRVPRSCSASTPPRLDHRPAIDLVARSSGSGTTRFAIDSLAGLFLTLLFAIAVCVSACFVSWAGPPDTQHRRGTASGYLLLVGFGRRDPVRG